MAAYRYTGGGISVEDYDFGSYFLEDKYNAVALGINSKFFFKKTRRWYFDPQFYYRRWTDKNEFANDTLTNVYTKRVNHIGVKLLFGTRVPLSRKGTIRPVMTFYTGIGGRMVTNINTQESSHHGIPDPATRHTRKDYEPNLHLGFTLGVEWHKKTWVSVSE
jgi:hypothetical protein